LIKVGITGGIGSGKTTVCAIFERLGVPVYYSDKRAKDLMQEDKQLVLKIRNLFGESAYNEDKSLNRVYIAEQVFGNESKLLALNELVHPAVRKDYESWASILENKGYPYCIKEAALLVESGSYKDLDKLIVVTAPVEDRISRVIARDGTTAEQVKKRIDAQLPDEQKLKLADYVIINDKATDLVPQVTKIHLDITSSN
jgi:dephospho-CoA kinase